MKIKSALRTSIITLMGTSLLACGASLEEYQKFSAAGQEYAVALDSLLVTSGNYFVDANSEILLRDDLGEPTLDTQTYNQITTNDKQWLELIARMRVHTDLLKRYFLALENLATSNAPEQAQQVTERIFTQLNSVGTKIQGTSLISNEAGTALSQIPEIILSQKIEGALREELQERKEAIYRELILQDLVLKLLTNQIEKNLQIIQDNKDARTTLPLYTAPEPISDPDAWIEQRRNIRTMTISVEALKNAAQASDEFKKSFQLLLEDKFTLARANALLADIESLIKVAEDIKKATNSSTTGE